jgi:hypothetical protein
MFYVVVLFFFLVKRAARASRSSAAQRAIRARYETAISDMRNAAPITLGLVLLSLLTL